MVKYNYRKKGLTPLGEIYYKGRSIEYPNAYLVGKDWSGKPTNRKGRKLK